MSVRTTWLLTGTFLAYVGLGAGNDLADYLRHRNQGAALPQCAAISLVRPACK